VKEHTVRSAISLMLFAMMATGSAAPAIAATNGLDAQFGTGGFVLLGQTPTSGLRISRITALVALSDGKLLIGGGAPDDSGLGAGTILAGIGRLNADGSWDTSFGDHGLFVLPYGSTSAPFGGIVNHLALMSDGGIIASGGIYTSFPFYNGFDTCSLLIKLSSTGTLDSGFASDHSGSFCFEFAPNSYNHHPTGHYEGLQVDSDDTIYLTTPTTNLDNGAVARFDASGALVSAWGSNGIAAFPPGDIFGSVLQIQPDHKVIVTAAQVLAGTPSFTDTIATVRIDISGISDGTYGTSGKFDFPIYNGAGTSPVTSAFDNSGRLLIASNDFGSPIVIARITDVGTADATFNGNSQQPGFPGLAELALEGNTSNGIDGIWAAYPTPDGHIFAISDVDLSPSSIALIRLNDDASYDQTFGDSTHLGWAALNVGGTASSNTYTRALAADSSGHVFVSVDAASDANGHYCVGLIRVIPDRLLESGFDTPTAMPTCPQ
jgi:uncharacterized delta-60 repeat protein